MRHTSGNGQLRGEASGCGSQEKETEKVGWREWTWGIIGVGQGTCRHAIAVSEIAPYSTVSNEIPSVLPNQSLFGLRKDL